jgi:hypothetical protein
MTSAAPVSTSTSAPSTSILIRCGDGNRYSRIAVSNCLTATVVSPVGAAGCLPVAASIPHDGCKDNKNDAGPSVAPSAKGKNRHVAEVIRLDIVFDDLDVRFERLKREDFALRSYESRRND